MGAAGGSSTRRRSRDARPGGGGGPVAAAEPAPAGIGGRAAAVGLRVVPGQEVSGGDVAAIVGELEKLPSFVHEEIRAAGGGVDVVAGAAVSVHPALRGAEGGQPTGYAALGEVAAGLTFRDLPGLHRQGVAILAAGFVVPALAWQPARIGISLPIHEVAHAFDYSGIASRGDYRSNDPAFKALHRKTDWPGAYYSNSPREGFALAFENYFHSPGTRERLAPAMRDYIRRITRASD
jgi:hypothetical protein